MQELADATVFSLPFLAGVPSAQAASRPAIGHFGQLYGGSSAMRSVYAMIEKVSPTPATVFVVGESGSGKELVARTIHDRSERRRAGESQARGDACHPQERACEPRSTYDFGRSIAAHDVSPSGRSRRSRSLMARHRQECSAHGHREMPRPALTTC